MRSFFRKCWLCTKMLYIAIRLWWLAMKLKINLKIRGNLDYLFKPITPTTTQDMRLLMTSANKLSRVLVGIMHTNSEEENKLVMEMCHELVAETFDDLSDENHEYMASRMATIYLDEVHQLRVSVGATRLADRLTQEDMDQAVAFLKTTTGKTFANLTHCSKEEFDDFFQHAILKPDEQRYEFVRDICTFVTSPVGNKLLGCALMPSEPWTTEVDKVQLVDTIVEKLKAEMLNNP